jgi:hypothetical protein
MSNKEYAINMILFGAFIAVILLDLFLWRPL